MKRNAQALFIEALDHFSNRIHSICLDCLDASGLNVSITRIKQFLYCYFFKEIFGLRRGTMFCILDSPYLSKLHDHIADLTGKFPGGSTLTRQIPKVDRGCPDHTVILLKEIKKEKEKVSIDLSSQPAGNYYIRIIDGNQVTVGRLVKY